MNMLNFLIRHTKKLLIGSEVRIQVLYKLGGVYDYINRGYTLKFSCVNLTVLQHPSEKTMYFKPAKLIDQIKYRGVITKLTEVGETLIAESLKSRFDFHLLNCTCSLIHEDKMILIKPDTLLRQLAYFLTFGYLRDHFILEEDYTILHKISKKLKLYFKNRN